MRCAGQLYFLILGIINFKVIHHKIEISTSLGAYYLCASSMCSLGCNQNHILDNHIYLSSAGQLQLLILGFPNFKVKSGKIEANVRLL